MNQTAKHDLHCDCGICAYCNGQEDIYGNRKSDATIRQAQPQGVELLPMPEIWRDLLSTWVAMQLYYHKASDRMRAAGKAADACVSEARAEMLSWCSKELLAVVKRLPVTALLATPRATGETTVEACLTELRGMFPSTDLQVIDTAWTWHKPSGIFMDDHRFRILVNHKTFEGNSADDCMAQVRAATRTEGEGEKP